MENRKIRVSTGITIEVNDNGDTIVARIDDARFVNGFYDMLTAMENMEKEVESVQIEDERERLDYITRKIKEIMGMIDELFGDDTCEKVFCGAIPNVYAITDFFEQLVPIFEEHASVRQKKISEKYNRNRKGSKPYYHNNKKGSR